MIVNSSLTIYHKGFDKEKRLDTWTRFNYGSNEEFKVWFYGGKGASTQKGYENANDVEIRIPYDINEIDINNFKIGDIIIPKFLDLDIKTPSDLKEIESYNITSITNNTYGNNRHLHLGGK